MEGYHWENINIMILDNSLFMINNEYDRIATYIIWNISLLQLQSIERLHKIFRSFSVGLFFLFESSGRTFKIVLVEVISNSCYIIRKMNYGLSHLVGKTFLFYNIWLPRLFCYLSITRVYFRLRTNFVSFYSFQIYT